MWLVLESDDSAVGRVIQQIELVFVLILILVRQLVYRLPLFRKCFASHDPGPSVDTAIAREYERILADFHRASGMSGHRGLPCPNQLLRDGIPTRTTAAGQEQQDRKTDRNSAGPPHDGP